MKSRLPRLIFRCSLVDVPSQWGCVFQCKHFGTKNKKDIKHMQMVEVVLPKMNTKEWPLKCKHKSYSLKIFIRKLFTEDCFVDPLTHLCLLTFQH